MITTAAADLQTARVTDMEVDTREITMAARATVEKATVAMEKVVRVTVEVPMVKAMGRAATDIVVMGKVAMLAKAMAAVKDTAKVITSCQKHSPSFLCLGSAFYLGKPLQRFE